MNNNVTCPSCGQSKVNDGQFCVGCGYNFNDFANQNNNVVTAMSVGSDYNNGMGIAGLAVSIASFVFCCGSLSWLSLIFSIIGMKNAKKNNGIGKGISLAGLIISIIGLLVIVLFIAFLVMMITVSNAAVTSSI